MIVRIRFLALIMFVRRRRWVDLCEDLQLVVCVGSIGFELLVMVG